MLILIDGCDKTGKSSIISDISAVLPGMPIFKNNTKPEDKKEFTIGKLVGIYLGAYRAAMMKGSTIFDRSHITEIVYSHRRGYSSLEHFDWFAYEEEVLLGNAVVIYMSAPKELIHKRFKEDKETYVDPKEIEGILDRYDDYLGMTSLPVLQLSSTEDRQKNLLDAVTFLTNHKLQEVPSWTSRK